MTTANLWPPIPYDTRPRGVRQILEGAGSGLKERTGGLIDFRVWRVDGDTPAFPFRYRCELRVDKLDYDYLLLEVDSAVTGFPVEVRTGQDVLKADDEARLVEILAAVFWSERTRLVIQNLMSMAND
jgi:hypothetical protein